MLTHGPITEHTKVSLAFTVSGFTVHWLFFMLNNHPQICYPLHHSLLRCLLRKAFHPHSLILIFIFPIMCLGLFHSCIAFSTVKIGAVNISVNTCYFQSFRCLHITPDVLQQVQLEQGDKRVGRERSTALSSDPPASMFDSQQ